MARSKRFLYSSGVHCPLIIRIPEKYKHLYPADQPGDTVSRIVSFVDMPKTWLSLAGASIPDTYQGTVFLGPNQEPAPRYHLGFRERADERLDHVRLMRDARFAYHKNYMPYAPAGQHLAYLWKAPLTPAWEKHHRDGKTNAITGRFFEPRVSEEFYDNAADFDNVMVESSEQLEDVRACQIASFRFCHGCTPFPRWQIFLGAPHAYGIRTGAIFSCDRTDVFCRDSIDVFC